MYNRVNSVKFHKRINTIILILSFILIIFVIISIFFNSYFSINDKSNNSDNIRSNDNYVQTSNSSNISNNDTQKIKKVENGQSKENIKILYKLYENIDAFLTIPALNIYYAPISEGTSQNVLKNYIGHFSNTNYDIGNIGLASHNRGSEATYFKELYKLKKDDYIFYTYKNVTKKYIVYKKVVIDSYDWSYLENTNENILTLITCINDKPNYRLCVQAIQI